MKQSTLQFRATKGASAAKPKPGPRPPKRSAPVDDSSESEAESVVETSPSKGQPPPIEHLDLKDKKNIYRDLHREASRISGPLIHDEESSKIHHILRVFDNSDQYGPCVGMSRLERWERAHEMGLNPPLEVRRILRTQEAIEDETLAQSVYFGEVLF